MIKPSVGRKVWYRSSNFDRQGPGAMNVSTGQPLDATVIAVWGDRLVNVLVTDTSGKQFPKLSVTLLQEGDEPQKCAASGEIIGGYVEWIPYQTAQAKAAEQH